MSKPTSEQLRDEGMMFLGKIIAVQSHEATNAFNVINEMAGLQMDILQDAMDEKPHDVSELNDICTQIRLHVRRGGQIIKNINWFAHSVDGNDTGFVLEEALSRITTVAKHWMRSRRVSFVTEFPDGSPTVETHPFFFAYAVLLCIDVMTSTAVDEQRVTIRCMKSDDSFEIAITNSRSSLSSKGGQIILSTLESLMTELGGSLKVLLDKENEDSIVFFIPNRRYDADGDLTRVKEGLQ
ncbi:MAG: hypothetical protein GY847_02170 [Proteobacteria bacterium]|nr:hypothetical protein [Pseudomonadota bacterium]